jgi:hypothetical protein
MRMRSLLTVLALGLMFAVSGADALANGDPASHVLPTRDIFLPSQPLLCSPAARRLDAMTEATREAGYPVKVAVIAKPEDLGTLDRLFGRPEAYARQLELELPAEMFEPHEGRRGYRLLVLMPSGAGLNRADRRESRALERSSTEGASSEEELARLATTVVSRLARATGHGVRTPPPKAGCAGADSSSSSGSGPWGMIGIVAALLAMVGLAAFLGKRGSSVRGGS